MFSLWKLLHVHPIVVCHGQNSVHTVIPADAHDRMHITTYNHPASANLHGKSASSRHHAVMKLLCIIYSQQRPWEVGSAVAERVGQGEVGWYT